MYNGPVPSVINESFPDHTYRLITCLLNGEQKKSLLNNYLSKFGYTRETYLLKFPGAPLLSHASRDAYKNAANSEIGKKKRSNIITQLNLNNKEFQEKRKKAVKEFLNSEKSLEYRLNASKKAKLQHKETNLEDRIRNYFLTKYQGSENQKNKRKRLLENNPNKIPGIQEKKKQTYLRNANAGKYNKETKYKKRKFKETGLYYQSSYELDFLLLCESKNLIHKLKNGPYLTDSIYPYNYYQSDYIFDDRYIIEIKSWYIESLQEKRYPGINNIKKELVYKKGYKFIYIKDKQYTEFEQIC